MPRISAFYGIVIAMYFDDHPPPHFHARYGEHEARVAIETGEVLDGSLCPTRATARQYRSIAMNAPYEIKAAEYLGDFRLRLTFADGLVSDVDPSDRLSGEVGPVFAPLKDPAFFAPVRVDSELGTVIWPNGAELAPDALHERAAHVV